MAERKTPERKQGPAGAAGAAGDLSGTAQRDETIGSAIRRQFNQDPLGWASRGVVLLIGVIVAIGIASSLRNRDLYEACNERNKDKDRQAAAVLTAAAASAASPPPQPAYVPYYAPR